MFESLSWIKTISIRKIWPAQLNINVVEYVPVAKWNQVNYLTADGTIFSLPKEKLMMKIAEFIRSGFSRNKCIKNLV